MAETKSINVVIDGDVYHVILHDELAELRRRSQQLDRQAAQHERIAALLQTVATADLGQRVAELVSENARLRLAVARMEPHAEDALDTEDVNAAARRLETGRDTLLPHDAVLRVLAGVSPVQVYREHRGFTLEGLAEATGIAREALQALEGTDREAEIEASLAMSRGGQWGKLSEVLGVPATSLRRRKPWTDEPEDVGEVGDIPSVAG